MCIFVGTIDTFLSSLLVSPFPWQHSPVPGGESDGVCMSSQLLNCAGPYQGGPFLVSPTQRTELWTIECGAVSGWENSSQDSEWSIWKGHESCWTTLGLQGALPMSCWGHLAWGSPELAHGHPNTPWTSPINTLIRWPAPCVHHRRELFQMAGTKLAQLQDWEKSHANTASNTTLGKATGRLSVPQLARQDGEKAYMPKNYPTGENQKSAASVSIENTEKASESSMGRREFFLSHSQLIKTGGNCIIKCGDCSEGLQWAWKVKDTWQPKKCSIFIVTGPKETEVCGFPSKEFKILVLRKPSELKRKYWKMIQWNQENKIRNLTWTK